MYVVLSFSEMIEEGSLNKGKSLSQVAFGGCWRGEGDHFRGYFFNTLANNL